MRKNLIEVMNGPSVHVEPGSIVIYHAKCADGLGAAWAFHHFHGDTLTYVPGVYGEAPPDVDWQDVYLVDFCYPAEVMLELYHKARSITVIDHHFTALEAISHMKGLPNFNVSHSSMLRSGAMLAWAFITDQSIYGEIVAPRFIKAIEDRDMWWLRLQYTKELMASFFSQDMDLYAVATYVDMCEDAEGLQMLAREGTAIKRQNDSICARIIKSNLRRISLEGFEVPLINCPGAFASDIGAILSANEPFAAMYEDTSEGRRFSLRSNRDNPDWTDVAAIAGIFGGGGHQNAAGFSVRRDHGLAKV